MKIIVKAKTRAKVELVERLSQPVLDLNKTDTGPVIYRVSVKEAPVAGRANEAIIKALAEYFAVAPARVKLLTGQSSKQKVFEVL